MKIFLLTFLIGFSSLSFTAQNYKLIPDSCTYCFYQSKIGPTWYNGSYSLDPSFDTTILGNSYKSVYYNQFFVRQFGNEVYGLSADSTQERLIMTFDVQVGDTLFNLYSKEGAGNFYNAVVTSFDSTFLNGGSYHRYVELKGFELYIKFQGWDTNIEWNITWNEKGLCGCDLGGYINNTPVDYMVLDGPYYYGPNYCTTDPLVPNDCYNYGNSCVNCNPVASVIKEHNVKLLDMYPNPSKGQITFQFDTYQSNREILITDIMGKEIDRIISNESLINYQFTKGKSGIYLVHILKDGILQTTQKVVLQR